MTIAIILAAGQGRRFRQGTHKALAPLRRGYELNDPGIRSGELSSVISTPGANDGTLAHLLTTLDGLDWVRGVVVVTGTYATEVTSMLDRRWPTAAVAHCDTASKTGPLVSLSHGIRKATARFGESDIVVLHADTIYTQEFWAALSSQHLGAETATICYSRRPSPTAADHDDLPVWISGSSLVALGTSSECTQSPLTMAPAVFWSVIGCEKVLSWEGPQQAKQAALIRSLLASSDHTTIAAIEVPHDSYEDIDTVEDLLRVQQSALGT